MILSGSLYKIWFDRIWKVIAMTITTTLLFLAKTFLIRLFHGKRSNMTGNYSPFMNKALSKTIVARTKPRDTFLKNRSEENKKNCNMERNYCVSLLRKSKRNYYNNLNEENICDNRKLSKVVKPLLSHEIVSNEKITLVERKKLLKPIR